MSDEARELCAACAADLSPALAAATSRLGRLASAISHVRIASYQTAGPAPDLDYRRCPACGAACELRDGRICAFSLEAALAKAATLRRILGSERRRAPRRMSSR